MNAATARNPAPLARDLDTMIRQSLRVSDAGNADEVAAALLERYGHLPRARAIRQESLGLALAGSTSVPLPTTLVQSPSGQELDQFRSDVEFDLDHLTRHVQLKATIPELNGLSTSIRALIQLGVDSARQALDTHQRGRAFAVRKQLCDYARVVRLVGLLTPGLGPAYRDLGRSLDQVSAMLLVLMGEAMVSAGRIGGRYLLSVSGAELQTRREAVLYALRNLTGSVQQAYGTQDWPRGLDGYRHLLDELDVHGGGDLRPLLTEHESARIMDSLIERTGHGNDGLRALGATARIELQRFRRLARLIGESEPMAKSPPLIALAQAVQLFVDVFAQDSGSRLLQIARPAVLRQSNDGADFGAESTLADLVSARCSLAGALDANARCACDDSSIRLQAKLDLILRQLDRSIDLYAGAETPRSQPEARATITARLAETVIAQPLPPELAHPQRVGKILDSIVNIFEPMQRPNPRNPAVSSEWLAVHSAELELEQQVRALASSDAASDLLGSLVELIEKAADRDLPKTRPVPTSPEPIECSVARIADHLMHPKSASTRVAKGVDLIAKELEKAGSAGAAIATSVDRITEQLREARSADAAVAKDVHRIADRLEGNPS